ncbi:hypothetical protein ACQP04_01030 [Pseudonocardia halophobica]|uniref:hypothetical protein n=1 Tax=Pseudonocardia halophobica TaxID=29401 RepID=UPI003D94D894
MEVHDTPSGRRRVHGVRVVLVEPAYTSTAFESNAVIAEDPTRSTHRGVPCSTK